MTRALLLITRFVTGSLFVIAGWSKLSRPVQEFQYVIESYQIFPNFVIPVMAHVVPWVEFILGAFLILGYLRRLSAGILSVLCAGFIGLLTSAVVRGIDLGNCGCFGESIHLTPLQALGVDTCLLIALLYLVMNKKRVLDLDEWLTQP